MDVTSIRPIPSPITSARDHALVIGGSIAGLATARVLADHFDRVTILERDRLPEGPEFRKGVPQARHVHVILLRGQRILEGLFPGLFDELIDAGATPVNAGLDFAWFAQGAFRPRYRSEIVPTSLSRPMLETAVRRRLLEHPRVTLIQGCEVTGYLTDAERVRITGVQVRRRGEGIDGADLEQALSATLVVDASGRESQTPRFLEALGLPSPAETTVSSGAAYATRIMARPAHFSEPWKVLYIQPTAPHATRGAVISPLEGGRWHVTLIGMAGDHPPTDEAGFLEFARSLPTQALYNAIREATPLSPIYGFKRAENRLRHYDQLDRYLEGLVALGDAVYALNPVYGQGMTVAAMAAETLGQCVGDSTEGEELRIDGLSARFQKTLTEVIAFPWQMATGEDRRWPIPGNEGPVDPMAQLMQHYIDQVQQATMHNPNVTEAFYRVQQMLEPPMSLFRPDIVLQVVAGMRQPAAQAA